MGSNTLQTKNPGDIISSDDPNQYKESLGQDVLPRNSSGVVTDLAGGLGSTLYRWARSFFQAITLGAIASGIKLEDDSGDFVIKVGDVVKVRVNSSGITKNSISSTSSYTSSIITEQRGTGTGTTDHFFSFSGTIVTTGGPVALTFISGNSITSGNIYAVGGTSNQMGGYFQWVRNGTPIANLDCTQGALSNSVGIPKGPRFLDHTDFPSAGTHTYTGSFRRSASGNGGLGIFDMKLYIKEQI